MKLLFKKSFNRFYNRLFYSNLLEKKRVDLPIEIIFHKLIQIIINITSLIKAIINIMIKYHNFLNSIINDKELIFTSKFWRSFCYL